MHLRTDGGFYVYIDLREENVAPGLGSVAMYQALLEEQKVAFTPRNDFEDTSNNLGDRRFCISYAGGISTAEESMKRFQTFWRIWLQHVKE